MSRAISGLIIRCQNRVGDLHPTAKKFLYGLASCIEANHPDYMENFLRPRNFGRIDSTAITSGVIMTWKNGAAIAVTLESWFKPPLKFADNGRLQLPTPIVFPTSKDIIPYLVKSCDMKS